MHIGNQNNYVSLAMEFQQHLTKEHHKNGVIDQDKYKKMERKWTYRKYHVQDNADVEHKYVRIYYDTNQFPALSFFGPYSKPHDARGLINKYQFLQPKLGNGVCEIRRILCACVKFTSMLDKLWINGNTIR